MRSIISTSSLAALAIALIAPVAVAQDAAKQIIDLTTLDCRTLLELDGTQRQDVIMFYHGYVSGQKSETVADVDKLAQATDKIVDQCIDKPAEPLLTVFS
ncbi:MAG: HdeA/HdeB family chaperone, partial [Dongiaceae bacterium]